MKKFPAQNAAPLELSRLKVFPLAERKSLSKIENLLVDPEATPPSCSGQRKDWWNNVPAKSETPARKGRV